MSSKLSVSIKTGQEILAALLSRKDSSNSQNTSKTPARSAFSAPSAKVRIAEPLMLTFSNEAKKMMEEKAERAKKAQEKIEETRAQAKRFEEARKASKKQAAAMKISELKARLKLLVERMRTAFLLGDKRAAVHIAKEAASVAKELAAAFKALKDSGGSDGGNDVSAPSPSTDGSPEKEGEGAEGVPGAEKAAEAGGDAEEAGADGATEPSPEKAAAEAEKALKEAEEQKRSEEQKDSENQEREDDLKKAAKELAIKAMASRLGPMDGEKEIIISWLRAIVSMARATLNRKSPLGGSEPKNAQEKLRMQANVEEAAKEIEEAISDIALA